MRGHVKYQIRGVPVRNLSDMLIDTQIRGVAVKNLSNHFKNGKICFQYVSKYPLKVVLKVAVAL